MFEESLVESASLLRREYGWPALISVAIEVSLVTALVTFPLMHPEVLPFSKPPRMMVFAPPPVVRPVPPPVRLLHVETTRSMAAPQAEATQAPRILREGFQTSAQEVDRPALAMGVNLGGGQDPLAAVGAVGVRPVVGVGAAPTNSAGPVRVSTGVMEGRLIEPIRPEYPAIARMSRSEGTVVVKAVISKTGTIESAHVESGPVMLQGAALDAVRRAR